MKLKAFVMSAAALCSVVFLTGAPSSCDPEMMLDPEMMNKLQEPVTGRISVHTIVKYRQGDSTEATISTYTGRELTISTVPWITSKENEEIEALPMPNRPGYYNIQLKLTPQRGRHMWIGLSNAKHKEDVSLCIDGMHYRSFRPRMLETDNDFIVVIDGPFDGATAKELSTNAKLNYIKLNERR